MELSTQLAQEILNYLQTKPWAEVNQLIVRISEAAKNQGLTAKKGDDGKEGPTDAQGGAGKK